MTYPSPKEPGLVSARRCEALDGGWVVLYDRRKGGPREFAAAVKAGNEQFSEAATKRYVLLYRPEADECRTWAQPGQYCGTEKLGEARRWLVEIAGGADPYGVLPVADGAILGGLNNRQFLFCQHVLSGKPAAAAYVMAGYKGKQPEADAMKMAKNASVMRYMDLHRSKEVKGFTMTREKMLTWLQNVLDTPAGAVTKDDPLCQEYTDKPDETKIKIPAKLDAAKTMIGMMGWDKADVAADKAAEGISAIAKTLQTMVGEHVKKQQQQG